MERQLHNRGPGPSAGRLAWGRQKGNRRVYSNAREIQWFVKDGEIVINITVTYDFRMPVGMRTPIPRVFLLDKIQRVAVSLYAVEMACCLDQRDTIVPLQIPKFPILRMVCSSAWSWGGRSPWVISKGNFLYHLTAFSFASFVLVAGIYQISAASGLASVFLANLPHQLSCLSGAVSMSLWGASECASSLISAVLPLPVILTLGSCLVIHIWDLTQPLKGNNLCFDQLSFWHLDHFLAQNLDRSAGSWTKQVASWSRKGRRMGIGIF